MKSYCKIHIFYFFNINYHLNKVKYCLFDYICLETHTSQNHTDSFVVFHTENFVFFAKGEEASPCEVEAGLVAGK